MVLNMLSTATMVRLGYVYDNLMIDLGIANAKLRKRAQADSESCHSQGLRPQWNTLCVKVNTICGLHW